MARGQGEDKTWTLIERTPAREMDLGAWDLQPGTVELLPSPGMYDQTIAVSSATASTRSKPARNGPAGGSSARRASRPAVRANGCASLPPPAMGTERLTGALLDRLTHRVHILEANGQSYRFKDAQKRIRKQPIHE